MNLPVVNISDFTEIVRMNFNEGNTRPIFGLGKGGIGKTECIEELAHELGVGYIDIRLLLYLESDLKGIPYPDADHIKTIWLQNNIFPDVKRDGERGILVFDEITSVQRSVRTAAYQILNERRLGEYKLPDGWMIVCLGNGEEDGGDFSGMEANFVNRCSLFRVETNVEAFKKWAYKHDVNEMVLGYLSWKRDHLHTYNPQLASEMLYASPRSWKAVSDILNKIDYDPRNEIQNLRIKSNIGSLVGQQFIAFCKYRNVMISPEDIVNGRSVKAITELEAIHMTIQNLVKYMSELVTHDTINGGKVSESTVIKCANGCNWVLRLKALDQKIMAIKDFIASSKKYAPTILSSKLFDARCPGFGQFAKENAAIFK